MGLRAASLLLLWLALSSASEIKKGRTRNHGHYVCSTWGNNHFKTFDGDVYQFPGICEYNFVSDCREAYREFSVHIQRALNSNGHPEIQYILMKIKDIMVYLKPNLVVVDGRIVKTPYYSSGVLIESGEIYTKIYAKLGMVLMWNQQDALMVELDNKFNNHTCGLCGDYNGIPIYNEFIDGDVSYNSITYGNLQKISKPNAKCEDPDETQALPSCNKHRDECQRLLTSPAFADCRLRLNLEMYIQACMQDMCACNGKEDSFCLCSTISEYSRQCSHAGGRPGEWRTQNFCPKTCPATMVYRESSSPCMDTCSHLEISSLCEEHYMDGCFCPEGTVYDDISEKGCIPVSQCHCKLGGKTYAPGESISKECEECTCNSGRWTCKDLPCPGICSVEGGSHITTFDGKKYTFHGDCYYVLAKGTAKESYGLLAELAPCGSTDKQTCLKTVVLLVDNKKNVVVFRSDGSVLLNEMTVNVPHVSASFSIFKPSSNYFVVQTSFGLQMQIQLFRVMQLFVTVDQSVKGKLQGLCGNFNGMEGDDFRTTSGLIEATGSAFANTWKAQSTCTDQAEKLEDPCSLSIESANYAEHWCSLLRNPKGPFARCHLVIDPTEYYKKCKYDTCLCEDNEECLCAALSSYSRACAFKGIILGGWRKSVCSSEASSCPGNQVFLYNLTKCQQTCRSLADGEKYCLQDFAPVDGCGCPPNTYLDNQDECVPISQCPCYYKGSYLEPGQYFTKDGERCVCRNAKIQCTSVKIRMRSEKECSSNKTYFDCNASSKWTSQTPVQLSCHTPQIDHFQTECVSGCVCPQGLFDDGRGGCVEQKNCPCSHNNDWYSSGEKIKVDCNTCTCQKGTWKCTDNVCYGTCMIYGSGHYNTFDGKFYDFDGSCEYVATQDFCGDKNSSGSFSIITENVPCGTTGVTCSKAIKMFLGKTELKLENKDYKEIQRDVGDDVQYWNRTVGLYLVIEASNGVMLIWDKKTTVFIKLSPDYKGKVCGLCGNFDDKANNDFTTRSGLQESNPLEFGNSWKQSPMCPDVTEEIKPCDLKPHRKSWAEKECSIIQSEVFKICHSKVNPLPFYEACVHDACSCDSGGDCECFCSAVAAYAQECIKAEACVFWRTPDICPIFCDYYNPRNECDWHYEPCGSNITTCRMINNVSTNFTIPLLEGCYPRCPMDKPIYNEETKECVTEDECGCYIEGGIHIPPGQEVPTKENCTICICVPSGSIECKPLPGCPCVINGTSYEVGAVVGQVQDGDMCITYICAENGSVVPGGVYPCPTSSPTTISTSFPSSTLTTTTTITTTTVTTTSHPETTTPCFGLICDWTEWFDVSKPEEGGGDYETYDEIRNHGNKICTAPEQIECRAKDKPDVSLDDLGQKVECNVTYGLICKNDEQDVTMWQLCYNYEIRVNCCEWQEIPCGPTITPTVPHTPASTTTKTTVPTTTTTRTSTEITTPPVHIHSTTSEHTPSVPSPVTSTSTAPPTPSTPKSPTTPWSPETPTTTSSTPQTTTTVPVSTTPISTTSSTSTPTPTYTTTLPTPGTPSTAPPTQELTTTSTSPETPTTTTTTTTSSSPTSTTTTVTGSPTPTPTPESCDCIWTDWIDVSYPDSSDRNSGDYETFENILKNDPSWVCAKAENISCRAEKFPNTSIADLGQKVECNVNVGLICNNKDQQIGGIIPMPVCLNYEISICCTPNKPECLPTPSTTSTSTSTPSSTTSAVSSTTISTTAPTPTAEETPSSTTPTTPTTTTTTPMPPSTTTPTSSTPQTTTTVPVSTTPISTTSSTSTPTPTYTTTLPTPGTPSTAPPTQELTTTSTSPETPTTTTTTTTSSSPTSTTTTVTGSPTPTPTPESCDCIWTDWIDVSYPDSSDRNSGDYETFENILKNDPSWVCAKAENISCRAEKFPNTSIADLGQKVECNVNVGLICNNKDQQIGGIIPMPVCLNYEISICCTPNKPECLPTPSTTSTSTSTPSSTTSAVSSTTISTTAPTPTAEETPSSTTPTTPTTATTTPMPPSTTTPTSSTPQTTTTVPVSTTPISTTSSTSTPTPTYTTTLPTPGTPSTAPPTQELTTTSTSPETPTTTTTTTTSSSPTSTTTTVTGSPTPTPTPESCDCIWTDWIDVSYPDSSDRNSGDYETFENILKNDPSWVCAKAENISCRAEKFPNTSIADLGQKVECNVNVGLICNNKDQQIGGIIPMPVCLNYEISICCTPNKPECLPTPSTTSTSTSTPSSTTSAVSSTTISTTAPTPTAEETPSSTTPTTPTTTTTTPMPPSTTTPTSSTPQTTTTVPVSTTPISTTSSTSTPTPTYTTTLPTPGTPSTAPPTPELPTTSTSPETPSPPSTTSPLSTTTVTGSPTTISTHGSTPSTAPPTPELTTTPSSPETPIITGSTTVPPSTTTSISTPSTTTVTGSPTPVSTTPSTSTPTPTYTTTLPTPGTPSTAPPTQELTTTSTSPETRTTTTSSSPTSTTTTVTGSPTPTPTPETPPTKTPNTASPTSELTTTPTPTPTEVPIITGSTTMPPSTTTSISTAKTTTTVTGSSTTSSTTSSTSTPISEYTTTLSTPGTPSTAPPTQELTTTSTSPETPTTTTTTTTSSSPTSTTTTVTGSPTPTPTPESCDCIWTDWIDVSYPDSSDRNSGDYETFENILKNDPSWVCAKAENISCRAEKFPNTSIADLGQKVECNVNVGLICNNKDQQIGGIIPMPVCLNYEISICCTPNKPECLPTPSTTSTSTSTPSSTTSAVSSTTISTTAPTPTAEETPSSTTPTTPTTTTTTPMPPSTTTPTSSTPQTTTTVPVSTTPISTTSSTSTPTPTYTTTLPTPAPPTPSTPKSPTTPWSPETRTTTTSPLSTTTTVTGSPTPTSTTSSIFSPTPTYTTSLPTPGTPPSTLSTPKSTTTPSPPETRTTTTSPTSTTTTVTGSLTTISTHGSIITRPAEVPSKEPIKGTTPESETGTPVTPSATPLPTTRTTEISTVFTASTTSQQSTSPVSTSPVTATTSEVTETGSTTKTTTSGPTPSRSTSTTPVTETPVHETTTTRFPSPPTGLHTTTTSGPSSTPVTPSSVSTTPFPGTGSTTKTTTSGPTPSVSTPHTTTVGTEISTPMTTSATVTTPTTSPAVTSTTTSGPSSLESTASSTVSLPSVSTSPVFTTTSGTTQTESFTTTSGTTSSSFITINATTTSTTFKPLPPGSTTTSGPTATSTAVTTTGSSTHSATPPVNGSSSTTGLIPTTPKKTCTIFPNESYEEGDSWWLCECIKAICVEDNVVQVIPVICNPPPKPTCANGLSPVPVIDEDGCCWHWECDCYCTGWGDPHYMTFDGLYYSFQGNCTYVLVEEINKKVDNFGVYIDNYYCDARDVVSCPRTLIVRHETQEVRLRTAQPNTLQVEVTVNNQLVALPYKKFGVSIYESGINRVVEIPELKMNVTYNGLSFSIRMPYSLFGNNTQGQCGTCNNNTADDCMLPDGNIAENCEIMADHWQVVDPSKPQCSPGLVPTGSPSTTPTQPCKESSICELLLGSVFEPCHALVQPDKYYAACVFDSCVLPNLDLECSSLQIYAATCADQGACIDWRKHTNGVCSHECPPGKEYRACGPIKEMTCKSRGQNDTSTKQAEGCFCPNGTMLYDSGVDVCVKTCGCVGVDMIPREFGERFTMDCQDCICLEGEHGIVCEPHECDQKKVTCDGEGFYEIQEVNPKDPCCPLFTCKCNTSFCTAKAPKCSLGFEVHSYIPSGQCCPVYQCVPKGVCVHGNAEFLPNSSVFVDKCQNCFCTNDVNISTQLNIISCEHVPCNTYCQPGYELKPVKGECCGKCVQTKCIIHTADNSELILSPGDFKNDPRNNCTIYSCVDVHNQLIASTSEITCPAFNEESCKPGTISFLPNGCCKTCAPVDSQTPCSVRQRKDFIIYKGCRSVDRVELSECEGTCGTFSLYSAEANSMDHSCSCCRETSTTEKHVVLKCPGGHSMSHKYIYVESCSCQDTECRNPKLNELQNNEENDKASTLNRIKRAISLTSK
ncbi:mucin-2 [Corvus moneduloides]|uniref:mucin-2 n=1 Tax=Corvus moneduloides TaxID=1196302 RepID=UPI0013629E80|nr:mucin-2 [Corvus moneduloides]